MGERIGPSYFNNESLTVSTSSVGFTATEYQSGGANIATYAFITVEDGAVRYWADGTAPTAEIGHEAEVGDVIILTSPHEIENFRAIRRDGVDATLQTSFGR